MSRNLLKIISLVTALTYGATHAQGDSATEKALEAALRPIVEASNKDVSPYPIGTTLDSITISEAGVASIKLRLPQSFLDELATGTSEFDLLVRAVDDSVFGLGLSGFTLKGYDTETGTFLPLGAFEPDFGPLSFPEPDLATPLDNFKPSEARKQYPSIGTGRPVGSLTDRVVHMNAGHGWTYHSGTTNWYLQRGFVFDNIEDMSNADLVHQYVTAYLYNAGAEVFNVREMDPNPNMVIVDNDDGAPNYVEFAAAGGPQWVNSSLAGFRNGRAPYLRTDSTADAENPFSFGTNRLIQCVVGEPTAWADFIPTIPESGFYNVYVSHSAFTNRSPEAHYRIWHAGGQTDYYLDQRRYRFTWVFLGRYYFEAGRNPEQARVRLFNSSSSASHFVAADAVRFGGGMGLINRRTRGVSGRTRYDEEAVYHLQFSGTPTSVHQRVTSGTDQRYDERGGWGGRPAFASWLQTRANEYGAPAQRHVMIANHTNATAEGTARGIISYLYSGYENTIHDRFRQVVHNQIVANLRDSYGGDFVVNSNPLRSGQFGEANPVTSGGIPIFLGEWLFHDNSRDMALYHDPKFRRLLARGIYQGIVRFYQTEYSGPATFVPEPPRNFRATLTSGTTVRLDWQPPPTGSTQVVGDPPTGYLIAQSTHGRGFPPPTPITGTTHTISGLQPNTTYYFQLRARNAGGQSFPTETLAVRTSSDGSAPRVLVVSGFDKTDIATRIPTSFGNETLFRQFVDQMNSYDYIVEHMRAIQASGLNLAVSSAEHDAVEAGLVSLTGFDAVIWVGGRQAEVSTTDPTDDTALRATTRTALTNYLNAGGRLLMTGADLAWDLNRLSQTTFQQNTLRMRFSNKATNANAASPVSGSIFSGLPTISFGTGAEGKYPVTNPDVITPQGTAITALSYGLAQGVTLLDGFNAIGGWRQPSFSGQTNASADSAFAIATTPLREGAGSGRLTYVWGSGDFLRLYNSSLPEFNGAVDFSIWVFGDNSGHDVRICLRDSDNDLFVNDWLPLNFTGWREIVWPNVIQTPNNLWIAGASGDSQMTGPNIRFDSIQMRKVSGVASGDIYFDEASTRALGGGTVTGPSAAVQFDSETTRVIYFGFPFETIIGEATRNEVMTRSLNFLLRSNEPEPAGSPTGWLTQ